MRFIVSITETWVSDEHLSGYKYDYTVTAQDRPYEQRQGSAVSWDIAKAKAQSDCTRIKVQRGRPKIETYELVV